MTDLPLLVHGTFADGTRGSLAIEDGRISAAGPNISIAPDEEIDVGFKKVALGFAVDVGLPELHGEFVRDEFAEAAEVNELLAEGRAGVQSAKDFAAGAVDEARDATEDRALGAFPAAGGAKHEDGFVTC